MTWNARRSRGSAVLAALALAWSAAPAQAYLVAAYDSPSAEALVDLEAGIDAGAILSSTGEPLIVFDVLDIVPLETGSVLRFRTGSHVLPHGAVDFHETWLLNVEGSAGNVLWMVTGRFLAFETVRFEENRLVLGLGEGVEIGLDQALVDYRATVLEGARVRLALGEGESIGVAKSPPSRVRELEMLRQTRTDAGATRTPRAPVNSDRRPRTPRDRVRRER